VANHTGEALKTLKVSVAFYNLDGARKFYQERKDLSINANSSIEAMTVKRDSGLDPAYLVRCELRNASGELLARMSIGNLPAMTTSVNPRTTNNSKRISLNGLTCRS